jgi:hypothetical protein
MASMISRRGAWLMCAGVLALIVLGLWAWRSESGVRRLPDPAPGFDRTHSAFTPTSVRSFERFPLYWVGPAFEQIPLTQISAGGGSSQAPDASALARGPIMFIYSNLRDCRLLGDAGVACNRGSRLIVETLILCDRSVDAPARHRLRLRGVPAALFGGGHLELYTGRVSLRIYADSDRRALRLARKLRPANQLGAKTPRLPPPSAANPQARGLPCRS